MTQKPWQWQSKQSIFEFIYEDKGDDMSTTERSFSLKERQRQQREALILQTAAEVIEEKGYYDASLDEIAARTGIAKSTVYTHFVSKEALIVALFAQGMQRFLHDIDEIFAANSSIRVRLELVLQRSFTGMNQRRSLLLIKAFNDTDLKRMLMTGQSQLHDLWKQITERITSALEEGQASGELNPALPSKMLLVVFLSFCSPQTFEHLIFTEDRSSEDMARLLGNIFFDGASLK
jgi:AcrR family transcriptional regulator